MSYSLIVDIGNSEIEMGLFSKDKFIDAFHFATKRLDEEYDHKFLKDFIKNLKIDPKDIKDGIIFSVVPSITRLVQIIIKSELGVEVEIFDPKETLRSLKSNIDNPNEVGQDLIADILGAIHFYGAPVIVSDLGTVTKNIIIDKDGVFQGVSFFPGVRLNAGVLTDGTAQLPKLDNITKPELFFGKNTVDAMASGIYYCHVSAIKRFMETAEEHFGYKFNKVITGGFANTFKDDFKEGYVVDSRLVLKGMNLIYQNQVK